MFSRRFWLTCGLLSALLLAGCATTTGDVASPTATAHPSATPSPTPIPQPTTLYVGIGQTVYALDARIGAKRWTYHTGYAVSGRGSHGSYLYSVGAVTQAGSMVYFLNNADKSIYALSAADGSLLWKTGGVQAVDSGGYVTFASGVVIASSGAVQDINTTTALDPSTGKKLWTQPLGATALLAGDGVIYEARVLPGSDAEPVTNGTLKALNPSTGAVLWQVDGHAYSNLALVGNTLYANADDALHAFDARTGAQIWARSFRASALVTAQMFSAGTNIYVVNGSDLYWIDGATHAILWHTPSDAGYSGATANGVLCAPDFNKNLYGYDLSSGAQKWSDQRQNGYAAIVADSGLCIATGLPDTPIVAVDAQTGAVRWSYTASMSYVRMLASGGNLYVVGRTPPQYSNLALRAISEADGSVQWTFDTQVSNLALTPSMALG